MDLFTIRLKPLKTTSCNISYFVKKCKVIEADIVIVNVKLFYVSHENEPNKL